MVSQPKGMPAHLARAWLLVGIVAFAAQVLWWLPTNLARTDNRRDSPVYYYAAEKAAAGASLYTPRLGFGPTTPITAGYPRTEDGYVAFLREWFLYPPHFAAALMPLVPHGLQTFMHVFTVIALFGAWAYAASLAKLAQGRLTLLGFVTANLVLVSVPGTMPAIGYGNVDPVLWALFGAALVSPSVRAIVLTVAASIKPYFAWFALASAWSAGRRAWAAMVGASVVVVGFGAATVGIEAYLDWTRTVLPVLSQGTVDLPNLSIPLIPLRLAWAFGWPEPAGPLPAWACAYLLACSLAGPALTLWLLRRRSPELRFAACTVAAAFCAPYCLPTYVPLALSIPVCWWREQRLRTSRATPFVHGRGLGSAGGVAGVT